MIMALPRPSGWSRMIGKIGVISNSMQEDFLNNKLFAENIYTYINKTLYIFNSKIMNAAF